jgi:DNA-binding transcriptional LysR family regulator
MRTTRRLKLTQAGERFALYASKILADLKEAELSVMPMQEKPQGNLVISAPQSLVYSVLPKILPSFQAKYPDIQLNIRVTGRYVDLIEEEVDLALRVGKLADSSLMARLIKPCKMQVCATPEYWLRHTKPKHPNELSQHECLIYQSGNHFVNWLFRDEAGENLSIKVKGSFQSDDGGLLLNACQHGQGVFYTPSFLIEDAINQGRLELALVDYDPENTGIYALYPNAKFVPNKVRVFIDYLLEQI